MFPLSQRNRKKWAIFVVVFLGLFVLWSFRGINETYTNADFARDLSALSNLWLHKMVWLGPELRVGFPASPIYYYFLFPLLLVSWGNAYSLVFSQIILAIAGFLFFAIEHRKQPWWQSILILVSIGVAPWWIEGVAHPWNGHMYMLWVFWALVSLWFSKPLFFSALFLGIAIAIHPAAILVLPILMYEWLVSEKKLQNFFLILGGLLIPWTPIFLFEVITKFYLTREWLKHSSTGMQFLPGFTNWRLLAAYLHLSWIVFAGFLVITFLFADRRARWWIVCCLPGFVFLGVISSLFQYYLLGFLCALMFIAAMVWSKSKKRAVVLSLLGMWHLVFLLMLSIKPETRTVTKLDYIAQQTIQLDHLDHSKKYAIVNVRDTTNSTPQADDYRFFLRIHNINAVNIENYAQADELLIFIEVPGFQWQNWDDWHTQQFGAKKFISENEINGVRVVEYGRK